MVFGENPLIIRVLKINQILLVDPNGWGSIDFGYRKDFIRNRQSNAQP
jgi:hypothetical protein